MGLEVSPWFWGVCGAFIYAAPRWVVELISANETRTSRVLFTLELLIALGVGGIGAAAFGSLALTTLHMQDHNAIYALIGLFSNRIAPVLVDKGSSVLTDAGTVAARVLKALKGDEK